MWNNGMIRADGSLHKAEAKLTADMFMLFRVSDLQHLLTCFNRPKNGKKEDLLARVRDLLSSNRSVQVQAKIREICREKSYYHSIGEEPAYMDKGALTQNAVYAHTVNAPLQPVPAPKVRFVELPFFDVVEQLIPPTALTPGLTEGRYQENQFSFSISPTHSKNISLSDSKPLPRYEVQFRMCLNDTSKEQPDDFPAQIMARLNASLIQLPSCITAPKENEVSKRPGKPVNVTALCHCNRATQRLQIQWAGEPGKNWVISMNLVIRQPVSVLLERLHQRPKFPKSRTKQCIIQKFSLDAEDSDICATEFHVPTDCLLSQRRIAYPCRSSNCDHVPCFDAKVFLEMNERRSTWECPVCNRPALFKDLMLDEYFTEVISVLPPECREIEVYEDGSWKPYVRREAKKPARDNGPMPLICSSDPVSDDLSGNDAHVRHNVPSLTETTSWTNDQPGKAAEKTIYCVDLTGDSDESDDDDSCMQGGSSSNYSTKSSGTNSSVIILDSPQSAINILSDEQIRNFKSLNDVFVASGCGDCLPPQKKRRMTLGCRAEEASRNSQVPNSTQYRCSMGATTTAEAVMASGSFGGHAQSSTSASNNTFSLYGNLFNGQASDMIGRSDVGGIGSQCSGTSSYTGTANAYTSTSFEPYNGTVYNPVVSGGSRLINVAGQQMAATDSSGVLRNSYSHQSRSIPSLFYTQNRVNPQQQTMRSQLSGVPRYSCVQMPFMADTMSQYVSTCRLQAPPQYMRSYISKRSA